MKPVSAFLLWIACAYMAQPYVKAQSQEPAGVYFTDKFLLADDYMYYENYAKALPVLLELDKLAIDNANIKFKIGICQLMLKRYEKAMPYLLEARKKISKKYSDQPEETHAPYFALYYLAKAYHATEQIDSAITNYNRFKNTLGSKNSSLMRDVTRQLELCYNAKKFMAHPNRVEIISLGPVINSSADDYAPIISPDDKELFFTSRRKNSTGNLLDVDGEYFEDIYVSVKEADNKWSQPTKIGSVVNTASHESVVSISKNGQQMYLYHMDEDNGNLYVSEKDDRGKWQEPKGLGNKINSLANETNASLGPDGKTLYFVSDRRGGEGGRDLYVAKLDEQGNWVKPTNLGATINTKYNEETPYILRDGVTLFFSSEGHESMGGYDVFSSQLSADGFWSTPKSAGYPVNTTRDDICYTQTKNNTTAYYASEREKGQGKKDIYEIHLQKPIDEMAYLKGVVADPITFKPIEATIKITNKKNNEIIALLSTDQSTGTYNVSLPVRDDYHIEVVAPANKEKAKSLTVSTQDVGRVLRSDFEIMQEGDIKTLLNKANYQVNERFVMKDIYFDFDQASLKEDSKTQLDRLYTLLKEKHTLAVEISGHTDNTGDPSYNKALSERRAREVVEYLIGKGISAGRLRHIGWGAEKPIATNDTAEGRKTNRRTEFEIIHITE